MFTKNYSTHIAQYLTKSGNQTIKWNITKEIFFVRNQAENVAE